MARYANDNATPTLVASSHYSAYDAAGRLTALNHVPAGSSPINYTWAYDAAGRVVGMTSPDDNLTNVVYDATDQLTNVDHTGQTNEDYAYDAAGNRINTGYATGAGNCLLSDGIYTYLYDKEGNRVRRTTIATGAVTEYGWDYRNRLVSVTERATLGTALNQWASTAEATTEYGFGWYAADATDAPDVGSYGDSVNAWTPRTAASNGAGNPRFQTLTLGYDTPVYADGVTVYENYANGFVTKIEVRNASTGVFETVREGLDTSAPNVLAQFSVPFDRRSYLVDGVRVTIDIDHATDPATGWEEIDAVELRGIEPSAVTKSVEYTYDAMDRRIRKTLDGNGETVGGVDYFYSVYRGDNPLLEIHDQNGLANPGTGENAPHVAHRYLYGLATDEILASDNGTDVLWGLGDNEGTVRDIVNNSGVLQDHRIYDSFGKMISETNQAADYVFGYAGSLLEKDIGLNRMGARLYDPLTARWISQDPSGFGAGDMNLYRYVGNDPLNNTDPTGLCSISSGLPSYFSVYDSITIGPRYSSISNPSLTTYYSRLLSSYVSSSENDPLLGPLNSSWTDQMRETLASSNSSRSIGPSFGGSWSPASNVGFSGVFDTPLFDDRAFSSSLNGSNNYGLGDYNFNYRSAPSSAPMPAMPIAMTKDGSGVILNDYKGGAIGRAIYPEPAPSQDSGPAGLMILGGFVPGVGEAMDVHTLVASDSTWLDRSLSTVSLGANIFTAGFAPNFGAAAKAGKGLKYADEVADVAKLADKATAGSTIIRNAHLAGKVHPVTGIPFDVHGFPDFSGAATKTVNITQTGNRAADFAAANKAAGLRSTPEGFTWHHHQNGQTMQLVPYDTHYKTGHTGGVSVKKAGM